MNYGVVDQYDPEFKKYPHLNHLPDGAAYGFVEIDMGPIVDDQVYRNFEKQLYQREKQRKRKQTKEESYAGNIDDFYKEKFEKIKRDANFALNTDSVHLRPGVVRNAYFEALKPSSEEEGKDEETKEEVPQT